VLQETTAGDEVDTPPREFQLLLSPYGVYWSPPVESTAKMSTCPVELDTMYTAGPVPPITVPLTLVSLLTTAKSETSRRVVKTMLVIVIRL
jgi:hypothetical protein